MHAPLTHTYSGIRIETLSISTMRSSSLVKGSKQKDRDRRFQIRVPLEFEFLQSPNARCMHKNYLINSSEQWLTISISLQCTQNTCLIFNRKRNWRTKTIAARFYRLTQRLGSNFNQFVPRRKLQKARPFL